MEPPLYLHYKTKLLLVNHPTVTCRIFSTVMLFSFLDVCFQINSDRLPKLTGFFFT